MFEPAEHLSQETLTTDNEPNQTRSNEPQSREGLSNAQVTELDKLERFKYQGQEWTPKDLEKAILRQKDYTQKTQAHAEERKSFEGERKYYENLYADLQNVKNNPQLVNEFLKTYPEKFHSYLKQVLGNTQTQQPQATQQYDIDAMNRLNKLEGVFHQQEVEKNTAHINSQLDKLAKTYPDAFTEVVIGRVYETYNQTGKLTDKMWEDAFKQNDAEMKTRLKSMYGDLQKKQIQTNNKSKDVDAGGGTPGRAPRKFSSLADVTKHVLSDIKKN